MPISLRPASLARTAARHLLGAERVRAFWNIRQVATARERSVPGALSEKLWAWSRGFRVRSVRGYDRSRILAGEYLNDIAHDQVLPHLNTVPGLFWHKMLLRGALVPHGIRMPELIAFVWEFGIVAKPESEPRNISPRELSEFLVRDGGRFIWKPDASGAGAGIRLLEVTDGRIVARKGTEEVAFDVSCPRWRKFLVERAVTQHPFWSSFAPWSLNTMRICTVWTPGDESPCVVYAAQRMGVQANRPADNWSTGGIMALIDLDTGTLGIGRNKPQGAQPMREFTAHPETGTLIAGTVLPGWPLIMETVLKIARCIPYQTHVGWDLAMDASGTPVLIEGNSPPGVEAIQQHVPLLTIPALRRYFEKTGVI